MTKMFRVALLAATVMAPTPVLAQAASDDGANARPAGNTIIVTARKRQETLQSVPTTVAVATSESIERLGLDNLQDIAKTTPGLVFDESFGRDGNRPVIRGQANILGQSGVAYFIDGIYYTGSIADFDVDSIERMEVVKGPQSALYGRNTYSGAINIITKTPGNRLEGRVTADIAEHDRFEVSAGIRGPIGGGFGFGVNGRFYDFGGEYTNLFDGEKVGKESSYAGSAVLSYDNGGALTGALRGSYRHIDDGQPAIFATDNRDNNCFFDNGGLYQGAGRYYCGVIEPGVIDTDYKRQFIASEQDKVGLESDTYNVSLNLELDLGGGLTLTSLTGYNKRDATSLTDGDYSRVNFNSTIFAIDAAPGQPAGVYRGRNVFFPSRGDLVDFTFSSRSETEDWSQELRLTYESDVVDIIVGGYYFDQNDADFSTRNVPDNAFDLATEGLNAELARRCSLIADCTQMIAATTLYAPIIGNVPFNTVAESRNENYNDIRNIAVFGALEWHVTPELNIGLEGRYAEETIDITVFGFNEGQPRPTPSVAAGTIASAKFTKFSPRVTMDYQITPDNLLYAVYAQGQKPGGFNSSTAIIESNKDLNDDLDVATYAEEEVESFEVGVKNVFGDGALTFNVALFYNEIEGYQLTQNVPTVGPPLGSTSATVNAGDATVKGAEFELVGNLGGGLTLTANYALADSKFTRGTDQNQGLLNDYADDGLNNCSLGKEIEALSCSSSNMKYGSIIGKNIPRAPVHRVFMDLDYRGELNADWDFFTGANLSYTSTSFAQVTNLAETGHSTVVDARLGVTNGQIRLTAYAKNLFDEDAVQQIIRYADPSFRRNFIAGLRPGRRFGVNASYSF